MTLLAYPLRLGQQEYIHEETALDTDKEVYEDTSPVVAFS